jgi:hypothetical protein
MHDLAQKRLRHSEWISSVIQSRLYEVFQLTLSPYKNRAANTQEVLYKKLYGTCRTPVSATPRTIRKLFVRAISSIRTWPTLGSKNLVLTVSVCFAYRLVLLAFPKKVNK